MMATSGGMTAGGGATTNGETTITGKTTTDGGVRTSGRRMVTGMGEMGTTVVTWAMTTTRITTRTRIGIRSG
jgi:hypothetical protein